MFEAAARVVQLPLSFLGLPVSKDRQANSAVQCQDRHDHEQRAQAELKPAAFAFRRIGFGQLAWHGRIIPDRGQPEQGILGLVGRGSRDPGRSGARLTRFLANPSILQD